MGARQIVDGLQSLATRLEWLDRVEAEVRTDSLGEPALYVRLVVRSGVADLFEDGARLVEARRAVRARLAELGVEMWPYVEFIGADEVQAA